MLVSWSAHVWLLKHTILFTALLYSSNICELAFVLPGTPSHLCSTPHLDLAGVRADGAAG